MSTKRRPALTDPMKIAAQVKADVQAGGVVIKPIPTQADSDAYAVNAVNLKRSDWKLLRKVAEARVERNGGRGRPSVSAVIQNLIDENRAALNAEV